jgi:hypothetical protein
MVKVDEKKLCRLAKLHREESERGKIVNRREMDLGKYKCGVIKIIDVIWYL